VQLDEICHTLAPGFDANAAIRGVPPPSIGARMRRECLDGTRALQSPGGEGVRGAAPAAGEPDPGCGGRGPPDRAAGAPGGGPPRPRPSGTAPTGSRRDWCWPHSSSVGRSCFRASPRQRPPTARGIGAGAGPPPAQEPHRVTLRGPPMVTRRLQLAVAAGRVRGGGGPRLPAHRPRPIDWWTTSRTTPSYYLRVASHLAPGTGPPSTASRAPRLPSPVCPGAGLHRSRGPRAPTPRLVAALRVNVLAFAAAALLLARGRRKAVGGARGLAGGTGVALEPARACSFPFTGMEGTLCARRPSPGCSGRWRARSASPSSSSSPSCILARTDGLSARTPVHGRARPRSHCAAAAAALGRGRSLCPLGALHARRKERMARPRQRGCEAAVARSDHGAHGRAGGGLVSLRIFLVWMGRSLVKVPLLHWFLPWIGRASVPVPLVVPPGLALPPRLGAGLRAPSPRAWTWYYAPAIAGLTLLARGPPGPHGAPPRPSSWLLAVVESYGYLGSCWRTGATGISGTCWGRPLVAAHVPRRAGWGPGNAGIYSWYSRAHGGQPRRPDQRRDRALDPEPGSPRSATWSIGGSTWWWTTTSYVQGLPPERIHLLARFQSAWGGKPISVVRLAR
jgi:hypothetical protein